MVQMFGRNNYRVPVSKFALARVKPERTKGRHIMPTMPALYYFTAVAPLFISDETSADFNDLGRQLLGGFLLAVVVAVGYALFKVRWRNQNPPAKFISISASENAADAPKTGSD